jgi:drug/metabolite transporter (DMT)-like permease
MIVVAMLSILTLGDPLYMGIVLGGFFTLAGLYLVVYGQAHERWLKQLQAEGLDSMPDPERFGVVKEATDLRKPLLSS